MSFFIYIYLYAKLPGCIFFFLALYLIHTLLSRWSLFTFSLPSFFSCIVKFSFSSVYFYFLFLSTAYIFIVLANYVGGSACSTRYFLAAVAIISGTSSIISSNVNVLHSTSFQKILTKYLHIFIACVLFFQKCWNDASLA